MIAIVWPFERGQYIHRLVERHGPVCLVERESTHPDSRGHVHWEVIVMRVNRERPGPAGNILAESERYPGAHDWGVYGWTYTTLVEARARYERLVGVAPARQQARGRGGTVNSLSEPPGGPASGGRLRKTGHSGGGT